MTFVSPTLVLLCLAIALALPGCTSANAAPPPAEPIAIELRDQDAIRSLAYCYGRGLDDISIHYADRAKGRALATTLYEHCFDPAVEIAVYPVAAKAPFKQTRGIKEWVEFADEFYSGVGYSSTRHLMSNFFIERTGDDTARMVSYALAPHFIRSAAKDQANATATLEYYSLHYVDEVARGSNGDWHVLKKSVYFDEVWRGVGYFPNGNPDGF